MSFKVVNQAQNVVANKLNYEVVPKMQSHDALQIGEYKTMLYRLRTGWDTEAAMTTPSTIKRK